MKTTNLKKAGVLAILSAATLAVASPIQAQGTVAPDVANAAKTACIDKAKADGYTLKDILTVEPYDATGDRVKVVLNLVKGDTEARLTCGYTQGDQSVAFDNNQTTENTQNNDRGVSPWLWLLLPLIGIPLLIALTRGKQRTTDYNNYATQTTGTERAEGFVRTNGEALDVYSGPGTTYRVTGTLQNGDRVNLTGRKENNWLELENGGWIPAQFVETSYRTI
ncbi:SH3 domain-containing protein [Aphanothece hegewaldii CCALA 016]|uniref:SH3 domain-containing protein n=1 Tax=Aphanothece hegewaldii CCALA 016 TaxID=2107694 RepID=A0A2T1M1T9_9CHRO|nr:SH3 domain-containing protein [Aphanothece hegewaldii]PSF38595.1 SH3 domain-containing protein [Aphanothece hegewaldii CCALA 016]